MQFDDRLATVLRSDFAQSEAAARTQFRQLLDLLGSMPADAAGPLVEAGFQRLDELREDLPGTIQSAILRAPGLRLRNRALAGFLAEGEPQAAAAAMATAQLSERDWLHLIPRLPVTARGFLRHRRDLPFSVRQVLERLGVSDLVLPEPRSDGTEPRRTPAISPEHQQSTESEAGIGELVRRIEAFQQARRTPVDPYAAAGADRDSRQRNPDGSFDFSTDAERVIDWAEPAMAPLVVGMRLAGERPGGVATLDAEGALRLSRRLPLRNVQAEIVGPARIQGTWRVDAAPMFAPSSGQFIGYRGRMRRPRRASTAGQANESADRARQILHELRTPVGAIQGFAELIQQQLFGPAPNEYRALAAAIAVDAARLLAGFDELDRLAQLETKAMRPAEGRSDMRAIVTRLLQRLDGALRPRGARIDLTVRGSPFIVNLDESETLQLGWRLLATIAGALAPGEVINLALSADDAEITLKAELPASLSGSEDLFKASAPSTPRAVTAGMFGTGFTLRLARAEVEAAGGRLERENHTLRLHLPALTAPAAANRHDEGEGGSAAA